ncbi:unnamed protein product [Adineta steineri]|uniref:Uncharacterized protein n=1 Tax=Adineta steineri TaxID=433720 RepID=A0A814TRI1_9BILA|nr:unnamed protein product [Adineta steineri]CAF1165832.1 unnamed protein product [Adineta steineri]CAF1351449.1 unnamed protein product [Adineta steineri]
MSNKPPRSSRNCFVAIYSYIIRQACELNLFSSNPFWSPSLNLSEQILSTRLFLFFLSVSLLIVITYTSLIIRTHSNTLEKFTLDDFEQLQARYPTTINVPCTQVSNPYNEFVDLSVLFHPVCTSEFVSDQWISSLFHPNKTYDNVLDFRTFIFAQFQSLALLCQTAMQSVEDGLRTFNSTHLVTGQVFSRPEFNEIIDVVTHNFQNNLLENENRTAKVILLAIAQNGFLSALRTNYFIQSKNFQDSFLIYSELYLRKNSTASCNCRLEENQCTYPAYTFHNSTITKFDKLSMSEPSAGSKIAGFMAGCLPMESLRQSTLECLYDQSCIDILSLQPDISRPKPLQRSSTRFSPDLTVGSMFDESLFIESWQNETSFETYFSLCAPRSLTYTYEGRFHLAAIITISISAFGGLCILWDFVTPAIVKIWYLIKWKKQKKQQEIPLEQINTEQTTVKASPTPKRKAVTSYVRRRIKTFNLFPPDDESDVEEENVGIISTRLYIFLLLFGLIILGFYTSLVKRTQTHTVDFPSLDTYEELRSLHSSLVCSCSRFSMSYGRVMTISPRYHPICTSEFVTKSWLSYFDLSEVNMNTTFFIGRDFRVSGQLFFNNMRDLCRTANETVEHAIRSFQSRRLVTVNLLSRKKFNDQTKTRLKQFEQQTKAYYVNLPELLRSSFHINHLITNSLTSAAFSSIFDNHTSKWMPSFYSQDIYNSSCSCALSSECVRPQGFYLQADSDNLHPKVVIPGLFHGCYTIDSILLSNLGCFFDGKCIKLLLDMYFYDAADLLQSLDIHVRGLEALRKENSRFTPNTTIGTIVSQLFIEDWGTSRNFTSYFDRCLPKQCTYSLVGRFDRTYIIAMMLGFYSGLGAILEIILPHIVRFVRRQWKKRRNASTTIEVYIDSSTDLQKSSLCHKICHYFRSLNLFASEQDSTDEIIKRDEIIATRIYLILLFISLVIVFLYAGPFTEETKTTVIGNPTPDKINELHSRNISTLSCPCSTAAIAYSRFLSIIPEYHPICSSHYVKSSYLINLVEQKDSISTQIATHYSILASLCQQAQRIVKRAVDSFGARELVSAETMTRTSYLTQTESLLSTFISEIPSDYRRTITLIIRSFGVNHLLNVFTKNWKLEFTDENENYIMKAYPHRFSSSNCSCALSFDCNEQVHENIVSGCFPYDGFRLSKFRNITFGHLNDKLFIEKWKNRSNYSAYFQVCRPLECRYTLPDRNNPFIIATTILGIYGGLICALRLIISQSLHAYRWSSGKRQKPQQQPEISFINPIAT